MTTKRVMLAVAAVLWGGTAVADWLPDPGEPLQVAAADAIAGARAGHGELQSFFDDACAVAVFPAIRRFGLGAGYAWGRGILLTGDRMTATISQQALSLGPQLGGQTETQFVFFRRCEAAEALASDGNLGPVPGRLEFTGRASAAAFAGGGSADAGFSSDVAIISLLRGGLMLELAAAVVRYRVTPGPGDAH
jgi:hypothetical protein